MFNIIKKLFAKRDPWEMGQVGCIVARRHRKTGECQFVLWKAGEQGHKQDFWHRFGLGHEKNFIPIKQK